MNWRYCESLRNVDGKHFKILNKTLKARQMCNRSKLSIRDRIWDWQFGEIFCMIRRDDEVYKEFSVFQLLQFDTNIF